MINVGRFASTLLMIGTMTGALAAQPVELVSRVHPSQISDTGMGAHGFFSGLNFPFLRAPSISDDGRYVVFLSNAANLVPGQQDTGIGRDVFLRDLVNGTTFLVSRSMASPHKTGNGDSEGPVISGDGRWVVFTSKATDLAPGQTTIPFDIGEPDLLLWDRLTETSTLIASRLTSSFFSPAISADGRYIAFVSNAPDLVPGQQQVFPPTSNVFLYDQVEKTFRLVSHASGSLITPGNGGAHSPLISDNGRYVAFLSQSTDLVPEQRDGQDVFLYDRDSAGITLLSPGVEAVMSADGAYVAARDSSSVYLYSRQTRLTQVLASRSPSHEPYPEASLAISDDGRYVAFASRASGLLPPQPDGGPQGVYLFDRLSSTFTLVSRKQDSPAVSGTGVAAPALSGDGRFVAFLSRDPALVSGQTDGNGSWDLFLFDRSSSRTTLVSHARTGEATAGNAPSYAPAVSGNGSRIAFASSATDLVEGVADLNDGVDVFAFETASGNRLLASGHAPGMPSLSTVHQSFSPAVSADGRWVAFISESPRLIAGQTDTNGEYDVFLYDRATQATILVSRAAGSPARAANGNSNSPAVSADGRWVAFFSNATNLVPGQPPSNDPKYNIFLFDRLSGATVLVGRTRISQFSGDNFFRSSANMTPDGRWIAFTSHLPNVVPGQQEDDPGSIFTGDVFLWDRLTGSTTLVSRSAAGPSRTGNGSSSVPRISDDGRFVAFASEATNLVAGQIDTNGDPDLFLYDRTAGSTALVSHVEGSQVTAGSFDHFELQSDFATSADGRFIAFVNRVGDVHQPGLDVGVYLYDRTLGTHERIVLTGGGLALSGDGRYMTLFSTSELVPGMPPRDNAQLYLYDRISKTFSLVTRSIHQSGGANDTTLAADLSADGRYVAFLSDATDLVPGQPVPAGPFDRPLARNHVFLFDRVTGTTVWISRPRPSSARFGFGGLPILSASGRQVAFSSSLELAEGDFNLLDDVYLFSLDPPPPVGPTPLPTCKLLDTRRRADRPVLTSNVQRAVAVRGACGVPATAKQVVIKVTVFNPSGKGNLRFYPGAVTATPSGILRFERGATRTETFTLPLSTNGTLTILPFVASRGTVHVAVEVTGYSN